MTYDKYFHPKLKEYIKCKMLVLQKDVLSPCSQSARLTLQQSRGRLPPETPTPRAEIPTETRLCLLSTDSAPGWAKSDSRVTKHFFQFLVNREFLAQIKNTTAPLCFLHMSLWQSVCSTDTGASICQCDCGKSDWSSRMTT